jgi:hypothetical protein
VKFLDSELLAPERQCPAGGTRRGKQPQPANREAADFQAAEQLHTDRACRADDCHSRHCRLQPSKRWNIGMLVKRIHHFVSALLFGRRDG